MLIAPPEKHYNRFNVFNKDNFLNKMRFAEPLEFLGTPLDKQKFKTESNRK